MAAASFAETYTNAPFQGSPLSGGQPVRGAALSHTLVIMGTNRSNGVTRGDGTHVAPHRRVLH